jgi:hypothetical protein
MRAISLRMHIFDWMEKDGRQTDSAVLSFILNSVSLSQIGYRRKKKPTEGPPTPSFSHPRKGQYNRPGRLAL